jgi:hypothetical protein
MNLPQLMVIEFGVAYGHGLLNLCKICKIITGSTGLSFEIIGFDSDIGMPQLQDYRDHPEIWHTGQFLSDHNKIREQLPQNAKLISGDIKNTLPKFIKNNIRRESPLGFIVVDVDIYSSAKQCFQIFNYHDRYCYLPTTIVYMDDVHDLLTCNDWTGEELAIREFNNENTMRKLQELRIRQNHPPRGWHDHIFGLHILDHPARTGEMGQGLLHNINITAL